MARALIRKAAYLGLVGAALAQAGLLAAQGAPMASAGYEFLKAVRGRDGVKVTEALNEPGSTLIGTRDFSTGETALHIVARRRDAAWVQFLLQRGANPNAADKDGDTPLTIAADLGFIEGVEALLKAGARPDVANAAGETPLISAVHRRDIGLVRLLLSSGASAGRTDNSGRSAREYAELSSSAAVRDEFVRAEAAAKSAGKTYGPGQ